MKKKIPLAILEVLQPLADGNLELIKPVRNGEVIFHLIDKDEESDFFYQVVRQETSNGSPGYIVEYQPKSKDDVSKFRLWLKLSDVILSVQSWLNLISSYNKIHTVYDDPILKINQERFEKQFEILDDDAKYSTFDLTQQMYLDEYLNSIKSKLLALKGGKTMSEIAELAELAKEVDEIQMNLTKETKVEIIRRLAKLWGKAQKIGLEVIKEIFVNVAAELAKSLLMSGI